MTNIERNFQKALNLYQAKGPFLPSKLSWKLDLILYMARGNIPNKDLLNVEQLMQYGDIQNLQPQSLIIIFNNIIDTLFNTQTVQNKRCEIKKKTLFANWVQAHVQFDKNNFLLVYSHKTYTFEKQEVSIKKSKQSKRVFELYFKGFHKYSLKFKNEQEMKSVWHDLQKEIIESKTQKNYEQMKTLMYVTQNQSFMNRITLFNATNHHIKGSNSPERADCTQQALPCNSYQNSFLIQNTLHEVSMKKKSPINEVSQLKPVPHDFICKLKGQKSIIAISKDDQARLYIEHVFSGKLQQKRLLSFLLLQKSWNTFIIMQMIEKTDIPNQIQIFRKYDTINELGEFMQIQMKATYSSWNSNMSMITLDSEINSGSAGLVQCNSVITLESDSNKVRILIEEQLTSKHHSNEKLKKILLEMYKEIIKLQLIHQKVIFRDFDAQTIIVNMLEDEQSTNTTQSQDSIEYIESRSSSESVQKDLANGFEQTLEIIPKIKKIHPSSDQIVKLRSPQEIPNPEYITMIRNRQFQNNYYNYRFQQKILKTYDNYIPHYRIDKLIEKNIYEITPSRELKFLDPQLLESQKDIFRFVLRQIGGNILTGKSILNVSLPVAVFEPRSALERYAAELGCAPDYLIPRAQSPPLEQIKYITGMLMNIVCCELLMQKPFNAILGETFQCYVKGIPVYYEQISHHPPISAYYMTCPEFTIYGKFIPCIDISLNTGVGGNLGAVNIVFKNGSHFECYFPPSQISGFLYGDRKIRCLNRGYIFQKKQRLYSEFSIQNQKKGVYESPVKLKGGQIIGGIFKVKQEFIDQIEKYRGYHKNLKKFGGLTKDMIEEKYHSVSGEWFGKILIDEKVINQNMNVYPVEYGKNVLPSDSNHRLDLLCLRMKDLSRSQKQKEVLQVIQRNDRKLREKYGSKS